jgi:tetratricopeptide (TPR) repeat protein
MLNRIAGYISLTKSHLSLERGDLGRARYYADRALAKLRDDLDFIEAYNVRLMMREGRHDQAIETLHHLISISDAHAPDADTQYIHAYCKLWLDLYTDGQQAIETRKNAEKLKVRKSISRFLPLPSDGKIGRIRNL